MPETARRKGRRRGFSLSPRRLIRAWGGVDATRRGALFWRGAALAALVLAGGAGLFVLKDEWTATRLEASAEQANGGPPPIFWDAGADDATCPRDCSPRADAALGVRLTTQAITESDGARRTTELAEAQQRLGRALDARPMAAGWWAWLAYARALDGQADARVFDALTHSYASAPFLAQVGPWRVRFCAANWTELPRSLRPMVVNEAVWIRDVDPDDAPTVFPAFNDPGAKAALAAGLARPPAALIPHRRSGGPGGVGAAG